MTTDRAAFMFRRLSAWSLVWFLLGSGPLFAWQAVVPSTLYDQARARGSARVVVRLAAPVWPEGHLATAQEIAAQRQAIAEDQAALLGDLAGTEHRIVAEFETVPFMALDVGEDALEALRRCGRVLEVVEDLPHRVSLADSTALIGAHQTWATGFDGTGWTVAVLDTGVDSTHPFLSGKVVAEACFSSNGDCPNGAPVQTGTGSGAPCGYAPLDCSHGTHVAGIAAGRGAASSGVARGASVISVQVFSRFTGAVCGGAEACASAFTSDIARGLEYVFMLKAVHRIAAVNMSLGGAPFPSPSMCNFFSASIKSVIDNLRSVGIATVVASGNTGVADGISSPACISSAVSVGSTTKLDGVSSFSNAASFGPLLLAPGSSILSSVPGDTFATFSGTSMATPHVAGAWAVMKQKSPGGSVEQILGALQSTGVPITDGRNGLTYRRIRVFDAVHSLALGGTPGIRITMSKNVYGVGDTVTASEFRVENSGMTPARVWLQVELSVPGFKVVPLMDLGRDGTFLLPSKLDMNLGPIELLKVTDDETRRGEWIITARTYDPTTGLLLFEDRNPFFIFD